LAELEEVLDVFGVSGDEVVHADHLVPLFDEAVTKVRPEEPGAAGDECTRHR
jgi:hypothetical protein